MLLEAAAMQKSDKRNMNLYVNTQRLLIDGCDNRRISMWPTKILNKFHEKKNKTKQKTKEKEKENTLQRNWLYNIKGMTVLIDNFVNSLCMLCSIRFCRRFFDIFYHHHHQRIEILKFWTHWLMICVKNIMLFNAKEKDIDMYLSSIEVNRTHPLLC